MTQFLSISALFLQQQNDSIGIFASICGGLIGLVVGVIQIIAMWKIFEKAGQPGWAALIPIYNTYVMLEIVGREWWWLLLLLVPLLNFVVVVVVLFDLAKSFGKDTAFGFGLLFLSPIFMPILGFGDAKYVGPAASGTTL